MKHLLGVLAVVLLFPSSFAQQPMHHPAQGSTMMQPRTMIPMGSEAMMGQGMMQMMGMMHDMMDQGHMGMMGGLGMLTGPAFDQAFLSMMIPHHQGAVEMSQAILASTSDAAIRALAEGIIAAQEKEIADMQSWLSELGGTNLAAQSMMAQDMATMMTMMNPPETTSADKAFLEAMIEHHLSAIDMGSQVLRRASDSRILQLAATIVSSQAQEVLQMRQKLLNLGE